MRLMIQILPEDPDEEHPLTPILRDVRSELERQREKWGDQRHRMDRWMTILMEEVGEAAEAGLEGDAEGYRSELVQVAAVALSAIESLDDSGLLGRRLGYTEVGTDDQREAA